jgi:hypothetical protein
VLPLISLQKSTFSFLNTFLDDATYVITLLLYIYRTRIFVVSSDDMGLTWTAEKVIAVSKDLREPYLVEINGTLHFYYFEAGTNPTAFEPSSLWRCQYLDQVGQWSEPQVWGHDGEVAWQVNVHNGTAYTISYSGEHYSVHLGSVNLFLNTTTDGMNWEPLVGEDGLFYRGGISEVGWEFDSQGIMWGVGRNEDGDESGWGSRILRFDPRTDDQPQWTTSMSDPNIYESPRMFRHEDDLYLVARTDPNGPYMTGNPFHLPATIHHLYDLVAYSLRKHGTAIWRLDRAEAKLVWVMDLPGCGDTAFPSPHTYTIFNYSSPLEKCANWPWIEGQVSDTLIYSVTVEFMV